MCYILQGKLTEDEKRRWTASANATADVSDDAIRAKEDAAAATLTGHNRYSNFTEAPRPLFCPGSATSPHLPPRPTRRPRFANPRCGCLRHSRWRGTHGSRPRGLSSPASRPPVTLTPVAREAKVNALP